MVAGFEPRGRPALCGGWEWEQCRSVGGEIACMLTGGFYLIALAWLGSSKETDPRADFRIALRHEASLSF